jgi:hypothetical protein
MTAGIDPALVEAVAAALVEPAAGLPGAATVGIVARVDAVLADYPRYVDPLREALTILAAHLPTPGSVRSSPRIARICANAPGRGPAPGDLTAALADLERSRPDLFVPLLEVIVGAWALSEPAWEALGYAGQVDLDPADHPIPEEIFQPLLARGPRWRRPPEVDQ